MTMIRPLSDTNHAHLVDLRTTLDDIRTVTLIALGVGTMNMAMVVYLLKNLT